MPSVLLTRPSGSGRQTIEEYRSEGGYAALAAAAGGRLAPPDIVQIVTDSDLRGRGGAAFPTGRKWALAAAAEGSPKYVVANGGEHEPGSRKDRLLVSDYPHRVLEGVALCAYATGASVAYLYLIEDMTEAIESAKIAIEEAARAGLIGQGAIAQAEAGPGEDAQGAVGPGEVGRRSASVSGAFGAGAGLEVKIVTAPTTYVAGEETAALEVIEGRKAWPRKKPPYPGQAGLFGNPTTVNNVETLAHVPGIVRNGAAWFRGLGLAGGAGTMLFTLDDRVARPGVYELPVGTSFRALLYDHGGGPKSGRPVRAILPALSSSFLGSEHLDLAATHDTLKSVGSGLGCGGVSFVEKGECIVERVAEIADFFMREQCGQCPACRMETNTLAAILKQVQDGKAGDYAAQIEKVTSFTRGKGYCSLIEMAAAPVLSALRLFPEDFAHHAAKGSCPPH